MAMVSVRYFRVFCGWPAPGASSIGLIDVSRSDSEDDMVRTFKIGTPFETARGDLFYSTSLKELNESQLENQIPVQADKPGIQGNLEAQTLWKQTHSGIIVKNLTAFSGGLSEVKQFDVCEPVMAKNLSDEVITSNIDIAEDIVKGLAGYRDNESLPVSERIKNAISTCVLYLLENRSSKLQETDFNISDNSPLKFSSKSRFNQGALTKAVYDRIVSLIGPHRKHSRFIPPYDEEEAS